MTTKTEYTTEEWDVLLRSVPYVTTYIISADLTVIGSMREMRALSKALKHPHPPETAQELVTALVADIKARIKHRKKVETPEAEEGQDALEPVRAGLRETAVLLDKKCTPEEAAGFKQWLMDIAQAVAEADKEHKKNDGRVSDKEKEALAEISSMLNGNRSLPQSSKHIQLS